MAIDVSQDIRDRTFNFACTVVTVGMACDAEYRLRSIIDQLLRSATAVGANLEEAKAASSKREFLRYVQISLKESREARYWLRICAHLKLGPEAHAAIVVSTKRRMIVGHAVFAFCILNFAFLLSS